MRTTSAAQRDSGVPYATVALWFAASVVLALAGMFSFRDGFAGDRYTAWIVNGPRVLLALGAGAALGLSGTIRLQRGAADPLHEMRILAVSAGAGGVGWLSAIIVPSPLALVAFVIAGAVGAATLDRFVVVLDRPRRWSNLALAAVLAACAALVAFSGTYVRERQDVIASIVPWLLGDLTHASFAAVAVLSPLVILLLWIGCRVDSSHEGPHWIETTAWALSIGAVGPLAFVGTLAPRAVAWISRDSSLARARLTSALCTGATVAAIDAVPRYLVGGYDFPWNLPAAMLAVPIFLGWNRHRLRRVAGAAGWIFEGFELALIVGLTIGGAFAARTLSHVIQLAT